MKLSLNFEPRNIESRNIESRNIESRSIEPRDIGCKFNNKSEPIGKPVQIVGKPGRMPGFTLIELIMVIVILGVLSAFALPRFADLGHDAENAAASGGLAAVKSAAGIVHAAWLADGGTASTVILEGPTKITLVNGYPSGDDADAGTVSDAASLDGFTSVDDNKELATMRMTHFNGNCSFTYKEAPVGGTPTFSKVSC